MPLRVTVELIPGTELARESTMTPTDTSACPVCGRKGNKHNPGCPYPKSTAGQYRQLREALLDLGRTIKKVLWRP